MKALVVRAPEEFEVVDVPLPRPRPNEVLCKVRAVAICGTDSHIIAGDFPGFWPRGFPFIPGHEWSGEVVEMGSGVEHLGWEVGDRVAGTSHAPCGFCRKCIEGRYNLCENYGRDGLHAQYGHNVSGAYAEYVVHSIRSVFNIPDEMDFDRAAVLDPASIALHTSIRGGVQPGDVVAVTGSGVMGLLCAESSQALGAGRVIVVGRGDRLKVAEKLGYDVVDVTKTDPVETVRQMTASLGAEVALECSGAPEALRWCLGLLRRGGRCAVVGIPLDEVALPIQSMVLDEIDLVGVRASAGEMSQVIPLVMSGRIRVEELITHRFPLSQFPEAFETFRTRANGALKVIIQP
jgi:L-iditol 2-dehydrogenase